MTACRDTACRVRQCTGRHRGCFGHGMPCPYFIDSPFTFPFSVFRLAYPPPPLCPSKLGGRAKRRGYAVKKNGERRTGSEETYPLRSFAPRPPISEGQSGWAPETRNLKPGPPALPLRHKEHILRRTEHASTPLCTPRYTMCPIIHDYAHALPCVRRMV